MRLVQSVASALLIAGCASAARPPELPEAVRKKSAEYARRAEAEFAAGDRELGFAWATRALVERLAACGLDCPEVAQSFVQLGDLRHRNGQTAWAAQSYRRALELFEPHAKTHRSWIAATRSRLERACQTLNDATPACSAPRGSGS